MRNNRLARWRRAERAVQTKVSVDNSDNGKSIHLEVGDLLEVSLPETSAGARWEVEVDTSVLAPLSSSTDTQAVWVLGEVEQVHLRMFRAAQAGHALLKMSYKSVTDGTPLGSFTLEMLVGKATRPRPVRQAMPAPQLIVISFQFFLVAAAAALLSLWLAITIAAHKPEATGHLLIALLATAGMTSIAGFLLVRIVAFFASRTR